MIITHRWIHHEYRTLQHIGKTIASQDLPNDPASQAYIALSLARIVMKIAGLNVEVGRLPPGFKLSLAQSGKRSTLPRKYPGTTLTAEVVRRKPQT